MHGAWDVDQEAPWWHEFLGCSNVVPWLQQPLNQQVPLLWGTSYLMWATEENPASFESNNALPLSMHMET